MNTALQRTPQELIPGEEIEREAPTIRLHLWLESDEGVFFGYGRLLLLDKVEKTGSLKKAAEALGMSYRAAWGKIKTSEEIMNTKLIERVGNRRSGQKLTAEGRELMNMFHTWFESVEKAAKDNAEDIFPWNTKSYHDR
ncbi:winged helix-turn-helix domain-containing protein [Maridesulfovibrio bastinii]|uniref:winged helix-turn-helix domain-containing protein n=1 Tax=Maridesulfovibrio bastinii TaxID=47157 RepID=UPI0004215258|nr:LysR family transcriptional regulator [Maridesulfovibrio bastinii]